MVFKDFNFGPTNSNLVIIRISIVKELSHDKIGLILIHGVVSLKVRIRLFTLKFRKITFSFCIIVLRIVIFSDIMH